MTRLDKLAMVKAEAAVRYGMVHLISGVLPIYVINEYPKSGGTWLGQMLSRALGVPFQRNRFPALRPSMLLGHYLRPWGMRNVVVVWRDGRDVAVSNYHACLFPNEIGNARLVARVRRDLPFNDYEDVCKNLPAFLEYSFTRLRHPPFTWAEFVRRWHGREGAIHARYEDLIRDATAELGRVYAELTGKPLEPEKASTISEEFSFARQSGRLAGVEDKNRFLRKGIVGDWRNCFNREARLVFDKYAGRELLLLGYERDRTWVERDGPL